MIKSTTQTIDAVYEDNVLKPVRPLKGIMEHQSVVVTVRLHPAKKGLRDLAGTLTHDEAKEQQMLIDEEFEKIEGEW
jgi:predicted DNA-binding antitoxin AbrB/MazE fold protein